MKKTTGSRLLAFLLGALMLASLTGMAPSTPEKAGQTRTIGSDGPIPYANTSETSSGETAKLEVTLHDWDGSNTTSSLKQVDKNSSVDALPHRDPDGWTFQGWYTEEVTYNFYGIDSTDDFNIQVDEFYTKVYKNNETQYNKYLDIANSGIDKANKQSVYAALYLRWAALTDGDNATGLVAESSSYYALYTPKSATVTWNFNGWESQHGALKSGQVQQGGYCALPVGAYEGATDKAGRVLDGWYDEDGNKLQVRSGGIYVSQNPVKGESVTYTARWHKGATTGIHIGIEDNGFKPDVDYGRSITLKAYFDPSGTAMPGEFTWSATSGASCADAQKSNKSHDMVTVTMPPSDATVKGKEQETTNVTVTVSFTPTGASAPTFTSQRTLQLKHHFNKGKMVMQNTCTSGGQVQYLCPECNYQYTANLQPLEHQYATRTEAPSCTTVGFIEEYCERCGKVKEGSHEETPALGHDWSTTTTAGCGGTVTTKTCTVCGKVETTSDPNAAAHDWDTVYTVDKAATCVADGSMSIHCRNCDATKDSQTIPLDPSLHVWGDWEVTRPAGEQAGEEKRTCSVCQAYEVCATLTLKQEEALNSMGAALSSNATPVLNGTVLDEASSGAVLLQSLDRLAHSEDPADRRLAADILLNGKAIFTELTVDYLEKPTNEMEFRLRFPASTELRYLDANVFVRTDSKLLGEITETTAPLTVRVPADSMVKDAPIYRILREHDGAYDFIPCQLKDGVLYFVSDKFSTFAVGTSSDIANADADDIPSQVRTGSPLKPAVRLTINGGAEVLKEGTDYTLAYSNNVEAGTATVTVTGIGRFTGTKTLTFSIFVPSAPAQNGGSASSDKAEEEDEDLDETSAAAPAPVQASRIPQTADDSRPALWLALFAASAVGLGCMLVYRRKNKSKR